MVQTDFFKLLRLGLGADSLQDATGICISPEDWVKLYELASKLSVVGIAYAGVCRLPKSSQPPIDLAFQWASEAETIRGHNRMVNAEAARLTELFAKQGRRTAILKGSANARLYPDKFMRQCGDIDIWINGGKDCVLSLLQRLNLMTRSDLLPGLDGKKNVVSKHHVHLENTRNGVIVEAHFMASSGNFNPFTSQRMMRYLDREIERAESVPEGFRVPSLKFALTMQLSHIQRHFITGGIGLKQIVDYFILLQKSSEEDRAEVASHLKRFGLWHAAAALMWLLEQVLGLARDRMLCAPDGRRGKKMLAAVLAGGNFGFYSKVESKSLVPRWFGRRFRVLRLFYFDPVEVFWHQLRYAKWFVLSIPVRIRLRRLSLEGLSV